MIQDIHWLTGGSEGAMGGPSIQGEGPTIIDGPRGACTYPRIGWVTSPTIIGLMNHRDPSVLVLRKMLFKTPHPETKCSYPCLICLSHEVDLYVVSTII